MMEHTRHIIDKHITQHDYLGYYLSVIEKIEENVDSNPDIAIESCKALFEGLSKTMLLRMSPAWTLGELEKLDVSKLYRLACDELSARCDLEIDFVVRTTSVVHLLGELRNRRGDISHGRKAPKDESSNARTAHMVKRVTDGVVSYLLSEFVTVDLSYREPVVYEDNEAYNALLDGQYPLDGVVKYSKALFDQRPYEYEIGLSEWLLEQQTIAAENEADKEE